MKGPTQTAQAGTASQWQARPAASRTVRALVFIVPVAMSICTSWWVSRNFPPERLGIHIVLWWLMIAALAILVMQATDRVARRFLPLAALLKLSLVFPDEAPSRFKQSLRQGTTNQLAKQMADHKANGRFTDETTYGDYLLGLTSALADHDRLTRGHSERVRAYTDMIAEEMGLPEADRVKLHWAALLHDVGKLDVPSDILNKPGRPDEDEWAVLQTHPAAAVAYLEPLRPWLGEWLRAADEHHLRWDGKGYPQKIGGLEISLAGRIVAVADAYDVMTSTRSYKTAMSPEDARTELARCAGSQFDPAVTRAFLNIGLGRLRLTTGPLGWLGHTFGLETVSIGGAAAPVATAASTAAQAVVSVAAVAATAGTPVVEAPQPPPPAVAFADDVPTTTTLPISTTSSSQAPSTTSAAGTAAPVTTNAPSTSAPTTTVPTTTTSTTEPAAVEPLARPTTSTTTTSTTTTSTTTTPVRAAQAVAPTTTSSTTTTTTTTPPRPPPPRFLPTLRPRSAAQPRRTSPPAATRPSPSPRATPTATPSPSAPADFRLASPSTQQPERCGERLQPRTPALQGPT